MVQWSPDTTPAAPHSGGYDYRDHHVTGFSLTHLSGAGCAVYGDFPFVPTTEALSESPAPQPGPGLAGQLRAGLLASSPRAARPASTRSSSSRSGAARSASR